MRNLKWLLQQAIQCSLPIGEKGASDRMIPFLYMGVFNDI